MRKYAWVVYKHKTSEQGPGRKEKERRRDRVMGPTLLCPNHYETTSVNQFASSRKLI